MGIESRIRERYGNEYGERNGDEFLRRANKNSRLHDERVFPNSRERRKLMRKQEREVKVEREAGDVSTAAEVRELQERLRRPLVGKSQRRKALRRRINQRLSELLSAS
jgi:hypothetical protein